MQLTPMRYALLVLTCSIALASLIHCTSSMEPRPDVESCTFVKQAVWLAAGHGHHLPVPDSLMQSDRWELPAPWYLGDETTTFRATAEGCIVVNR